MLYLKSWYNILYFLLSKNMLETFGNFVSSNFLIFFLHALFSFLPFNTKCVSRWIIFKMKKKKKKKKEKQMGIYTWKLSEKIVDRDGNRRSGMGWYEVGIVNSMATEECRHTSDKCRVRIADFTRRTLLIFLWTMNTYVCSLCLRMLVNAWRTSFLI